MPGHIGLFLGALPAQAAAADPHCTVLRHAASICSGLLACIAAFITTQAGVKRSQAVHKL